MSGAVRTSPAAATAEAEQPAERRLAAELALKRPEKMSWDGVSASMASFPVKCS